MTRIDHGWSGHGHVQALKLGSRLLYQRKIPSKGCSLRVGGGQKATSIAEKNGCSMVSPNRRTFRGIEGLLWEKSCRSGKRAVILQRICRLSESDRMGGMYGPSRGDDQLARQGGCLGERGGQVFPPLGRCPSAASGVWRLPRKPVGLPLVQALQ